jgi:hypothetical protein
VQENGCMMRGLWFASKKKWYQVNIIEEVDPKDGIMMFL